MGEKSVTTKDICALLGIAPQTIRLYEKYSQNLFRYETAENGYRDFPFESIAQLFTFRSLTKLGTTLGDTAKAMASPQFTHEGYEKMLDARKNALEDEKRRIETLIDAVEENRFYSLQTNLLGTYRFTKSPAFYVLAFENAGRIPNDEALRNTIMQWGLQAPFVFYAPFVEPPFNKATIASMGLGISEEFSSLVNTKSPHVRFVSPARCLTTVVKVRNVAHAREIYGPDNNSYLQTIQSGLDYLDKQGTPFAGTIYSRLIVSNIHESDGTVSDFYFLWFHPGKSLDPTP